MTPAPGQGQEDPIARRLPAAFLALGQPVYASLWLRLQLSNLAVVLVGVVVAWTVAAAGHGAAQVALVQTTLAVPAMVLALPAGVLADLYSRRRAMILSQVLAILAIAALVALSIAGRVDLCLLLVPCFVLGIGTALTTPAWMASLGDLVPRDRLPSAVALHGLGFNLARCIGPAIGGALVAGFGATWAYAAALAIALPFPLRLLRFDERDRPARASQPRFRAAMIEGIRYVAAEPALGLVLVRALIYCLSAAAVPALLAAVTQQRFAGTSFDYGVLLGGFGLGALVGGLAAPGIRQRWGNVVTLRAAFLTLGLADIGLALAWTMPVALPATVLAGASWLLGLSCFALSVQLGAARAMIGRAMSCYYMAVYLGLGFGSWIWGALSDRLGLGWGIAAAGSVALAAGLVMSGPVAPARSRLDGH